MDVGGVRFDGGGGIGWRAGVEFGIVLSFVKF